MAKMNVGMDEKVLAVQNYRKMMDDVEKYQEAIDNAPKNYAPTRFDTLKTFLERRYIVPEYQRDYAWKADDQVVYYIGSIHRSMVLGRPLHSLGDVIVHKEVKRDENGNRVITYYLVDGQQRTTTQILVLIVLRDILQSTYFESDMRKDTKKATHPKVDELQSIFKTAVRNESGVVTEEYALLSRTRPLFNKFMIDLYENVGSTFNIDTLAKKYQGCPDTNVQTALANIRYVHSYFHSVFRGQGEGNKRDMIDYYACFIDAMLNSVIQGVVELTNAERAKETYYTKNMTGMRMSDIEGFRFMIIANNTPEEERVEYGEKWGSWVDKYKDFGRSKVAGDAMGLLTLTRSNLKAKFTPFGPTHSGANETILYEAVKDTVVYGNKDLGIEPNQIHLAHWLEKADNYLDMIRDIEDIRFSDAYRQSYTYLRLVSPSPKWMSALLVPFDLFGMEAYKIIDKYIKALEQTVMFMMTGKDSVNMTLIDDNFDILICNIYRQHQEKPFANVYQFVEAFVDLVPTHVYKQKDGSPVTANSFKAAWEKPCDNKVIKVAVALSAEYVADPATFYKTFKNKELNQIGYLSLLEKSGVELEYGAFANMNKARWSGMVAKASTLKKNKVYNESKYLQLTRTKDLIHVEVKPYAPKTAKIWEDTIGSVLKGNLKNATITQTNLRAYSDSIRGMITANLGFNF